MNLIKSPYDEFGKKLLAKYSEFDSYYDPASMIFAPSSESEEQPQQIQQIYQTFVTRIQKLQQENISIHQNMTMLTEVLEKHYHIKRDTQIQNPETQRDIYQLVTERSRELRKELPVTLNRYFTENREEITQLILQAAREQMTPGQTVTAQLQPLIDTMSDQIRQSHRVTPQAAQILARQVTMTLQEEVQKQQSHQSVPSGERESLQRKAPEPLLHRQEILQQELLQKERLQREQSREIRREEIIAQRDIQPDNIHTSSTGPELIYTENIPTAPKDRPAKEPSHREEEPKREADSRPTTQTPGSIVTEQPQTQVASPGVIFTESSAAEVAQIFQTVVEQTFATLQSQATPERSPRSGTAPRSQKGQAIYREIMKRNHPDRLLQKSSPSREITQLMEVYHLSESQAREWSAELIHSPNGAPDADVVPGEQIVTQSPDSQRTRSPRQESGQEITHRTRESVPQQIHRTTPAEDTHRREDGSHGNVPQADAQSSPVIRPHVNQPMIHQINISRKNIQRTDLHHTTQHRREIEKVHLRETSINTIRKLQQLQENIRQTNRNQTNLHQTDVYHTTQHQVDPARTEMRPTQSHPEPADTREIPQTNLSRIDIHSADLHHKELHTERLYQTDLHQTNQQETDTHTDRVHRTELQKEILKQQQIQQTNRSQTDIHRTNLHETEKHQDHLHQTNISQTNILQSDVNRIHRMETELPKQDQAPTDQSRPITERAQEQIIERTLERIPIRTLPPTERTTQEARPGHPQTPPLIHAQTQQKQDTIEAQTPAQQAQQIRILRETILKDQTPATQSFAERIAQKASRVITEQIHLEPRADGSPAQAVGVRESSPHMAPITRGDTISLVYPPEREVQTPPPPPEVPPQVTQQKVTQESETEIQIIKEAKKIVRQEQKTLKQDMPFMGNLTPQEEQILEKQVSKYVERHLEEKVNRITSVVYRRLEDKLKIEKGRRGLV